MKPILKWTGGKRWLVPLLKHIWQKQDSDTLIEPFTGGMAIALGLQPKYAILNDVNVHLINFYQQVKKGLKIHLNFQNDESYYYHLRHHFNELIAQKKHKNKEAASIFYYLIRTGFNGLCRFNSKGEFNVPFGQHRSIRYPQHFLDYKNPLSHWQFSHFDFEKLKIKPSAFMYVDPPYDTPFTKYYSTDFKWTDQERLAHWLCQHKGPIIVSNQATDRILALYKQLKFMVLTLNAPRSISCNGDRQPALEMLALKGFSSVNLKYIKQQVLQFGSGLAICP